MKNEDEKAPHSLHEGPHPLSDAEDNPWEEEGDGRTITMEAPSFTSPSTIPSPQTNPPSPIASAGLARPAAGARPLPKPPAAQPLPPPPTGRTVEHAGSSRAGLPSSGRLPVPAPVPPARPPAAVKRGSDPSVNASAAAAPGKSPSREAGREEPARISRRESLPRQAVYVVVGEDAMGDDATVQAPLGSYALGSGTGRAALASHHDREEGSRADALRGHSPSAPSALSSGQIRSWQGELPPPSRPGSGFGQAGPHAPQTAHRGQPSAVEPPPPFAVEHGAPPAKHGLVFGRFRTEVVLLAAAGALCIAIFVLGVVLFVAARF